MNRFVSSKGRSRASPAAHRSHVVRPTAPAGQDVLHGQLRLHWKLKGGFSTTIAENIGAKPGVCAAVPPQHCGGADATRLQTRIKCQPTLALLLLGG